MSQAQSIKSRVVSKVFIRLAIKSIMYSEIIGTGLFIAGIFLWKKYKEPEFFWSLFPIGGSLLLSVLQYLSETFLQLSNEQRATESFIFLVLGIILFVAFILITLKGLSKSVFKK